MNDKLKEKCAVFGVYGRPDASYLVHLGLWALQHRGQESSGIASSDGKKVFIHKANGLVSSVYSQEILDGLKGSNAIGHNRYSTSGGSDHNQPVVDEDGILALAHNGNLPVTKELETFLGRKGISYKGRNDTEMMYDAIKYYIYHGFGIEDAIKHSFSLFTGAFSCVLLTKDKLIAFRDVCGIRPLAIGSLEGSIVFSSETCGLDIIGAEYVREVNPGEMVVVDHTGVHSYQIAKANQKLDIFEMVYFARPDSMLLGKRVNAFREELGRTLAKEYSVPADLVIPVPDSAIPMAIGYAAQSGIPFDHGLIKNRYIHRTFIEPLAGERIEKVRIKFNPIPELIAGKRVIVIDDSIVRGTTSKELVVMLKKSGAAEVHLLSASPPVIYPDYYGIDTPDQKDLIAATMSIKEICRYIGADSLHYLSYEGLIASTGISESMFCVSCFTGEYPIDIGERVKEIVYDRSVEN